MLARREAGIKMANVSTHRARSADVGCKMSRQRASAALSQSPLLNRQAKQSITAKEDWITSSLTLLAMTGC